MSSTPLNSDERVFYRDQLRSARYAALADSEGFLQTCYAIEALGRRLLGKEANMGKYRSSIKKIATAAASLEQLPDQFPMFFTKFDALYDVIRRARNDAMHSGSYARHATNAAIEMCIGLEEAVMVGPEIVNKVQDYMVKTPITAEPWHPVAHARQLVLTHSFSFLPVLHENKWHLLSEMALVAYLHRLTGDGRKFALAQQISEAVAGGLKLLPACHLKPEVDIKTVIDNGSITTNPILWVVVDEENRLLGVLSPFELM